jgi:glyoxylase-like metal-dependent hydrolase (beta-lactamase superfamily II)
MTIAGSNESERLRRPARLRSLHLGETTLTYLPDGAVQLSPQGWLPDTSAADWAAHPEYLDDSGCLVGSLGGLLVEREGHALLIDAGFGPRSIPEVGGPIGAVESGALLDSLALVGCDPVSVEALAFTHLHPDHIGWAWHPASGSDRPPFTGADYRLPAQEWEHRHLAEPDGTTPEMLAVLEPRVRIVADGEQIFPGVRAHITGGHTAGHATYVIGADDQRVIAFGDVFHSPIQLPHPEWSAVNDHDRDAAVAERRRLITELSRPGTIGFGIHFADVAFGRVDLDGDRAIWQPIHTVGPLPHTVPRPMSTDA